MPRRVKDLLGKVNRLDIDLLLFATLAIVHARHHLVLGRAHTLGLERTLVSLQCNISLAVSAVNVEVVVIGSRQDIAIEERKMKKKSD